MKAGLYRILMSVFVVTYMAVAVASHNRKSDTWGAVYKKFRWMHTTLCFWQNWGMFAPPPGSTSWLIMEGETAEGETIELDPLYGPIESGYFRWRYDRRQKLSLSSFQDSRKALRRGIARNACHRAEEAGTPVVKVNLIRDRTWAQRPSKRWSKAVTKRRHKVVELGSYKCR
jgi:hypothetical protein